MSLNIVIPLDLQLIKDGVFNNCILDVTNPKKHVIKAVITNKDGKIISSKKFKMTNAELKYVSNNISI